MSLLTAVLVAVSIVATILAALAFPRSRVARLLAVLFILLASVKLVNGQATTHPVYEALRGAGVNIQWCFYDPQRYDPTCAGNDFAAMQAAGFKSVRIPISQDVIEVGQTGTLNEARVADLINLMRRIQFHGMLPYPEIHTTGICGANGHRPGCNWTDDYFGGLRNPTIADRHFRLSVALLTRLGTTLDTSTFAFAPANEPIFTGGSVGEPSVWYNYQARLIPALRAACATCVIGAMGNNWQGVDTIWDMTPFPFKNDPLVFVDFHLYDPMGLTHCGASSKGNDPACANVRWPANFTIWDGSRVWFDKAKLRDTVRPAVEWARREGIPYVHFSEIGTTRWIPSDVRANYLRDLTSVFREFGIGYSVYVWNNDQFGIAHDAVVIAAVAVRGATLPTPSPTILPPSATWLLSPTPPPFVATNTPVPPTPQPTATPPPLASCWERVERFENGVLVSLYSRPC